MPELPELEVLRDYLGPRLDQRRVVQVWTSPKLGFLLRTPADEFARQLSGLVFQRAWRRGKFLVFDLDSQHLVVNPMLGGRMQWAPASEPEARAAAGPTESRADAGPRRAHRPEARAVPRAIEVSAGRTKARAVPRAIEAKVVQATVFRLTLDSGDELRFLDTVKMGRVYWVPNGGLPTIPGWAELGPDALTVSAGEFAQRIRRHPGELKNLLRNQAFIAGVGNAYSDEILHAAGFLPLRKRSTLKPDDVLRLHASTLTVLQSAIDAIRAQPHYIPHKQDRSFMAVHGKGGGTCPRCGHRISELTARGENTNFCRGCQR